MPGGIGINMKLEEIAASRSDIAPNTSLAEAARKCSPKSDYCRWRKVKKSSALSRTGISRSCRREGLDPGEPSAGGHDQEVFSCPTGSDVMDACNLMEEKQVRRLLVMDAADAPIGVVSLGDIALHLARAIRRGAEESFATVMSTTVRGRNRR
jgi:hypothetical protein